MKPKGAKATLLQAGPVRLELVLYDQLIRDISRADDALAHHHSERCAMEIGHALAVIGYLQATLRQNGEPGIPGNSDSIHAGLREKLIEAQVRSSRRILGQLKPQLMELREAWTGRAEGA